MRGESLIVNGGELEDVDRFVYFAAKVSIQLVEQMMTSIPYFVSNVQD